jgi:hypothetical protein
VTTERVRHSEAASACTPADRAHKADELWLMAEEIWERHRDALESVLARAPAPDPSCVAKLRRMFVARE